jgi:hypothetical protein
VNQKIVACILFAILAALTVSVGAQIVAAQSGGISYPSGLYLISPLNTTYTDNRLTLNVYFDMGIQTKLNYSIDDGLYSGDIPLTYLNNSEIMYISNYQGIVPLPQLSDGSHVLTMIVDAELNDFHGANPPGAPFKANNAEGTNFAAIWVHTIYFSVDTSKATQNPTVSATPTPTAIESTNQTTTIPTMQAPAEEPQQTTPLLSIIAVAAVVAYIAVIAVLVTRKRSHKNLGFYFFRSIPSIRTVLRGLRIALPILCLVNVRLIALALIHNSLISWAENSGVSTNGSVAANA